MKNKVMRFDMLTVGDKFRTHHDGWICTKIGALQAINPEGVKFNVAPSTTVDAILKDENATRVPSCDACGKPATLKVNDHSVCFACVDLASENGETPEVTSL